MEELRIVLLAVVVGFGYILMSKWLLNWILICIIGLDEMISNYTSYVLVVIVSPLLMYFTLGYEITPLMILIFAIYSVVWILKESYYCAYNKHY